MAKFKSIVSICQAPDPKYLSLDELREKRRQSKLAGLAKNAGHGGGFAHGGIAAAGHGPPEAAKFPGDKAAAHNSLPPAAGQCQPAAGQCKPAAGQCKPAAGLPAAGLPAAGQSLPAAGLPAAGQSLPAAGQCKPAAGQCKPAAGQCQPAAGLPAAGLPAAGLPAAGQSLPRRGFARAAKYRSIVPTSLAPAPENLSLRETARLRAEKRRRLSPAGGKFSRFAEMGFAPGGPCSGCGGLAQGELDAAGRVRFGAALGGAGKKEGAADSTRAEKFVKIKEKKLKKIKVIKAADKTVTARALSMEYDLEGGELPPFRPMTEKTLERMRNCLSWMKLATPEDYSKFKKTDGYTCRVAFCPLCAAFQTKRDGLKLCAMMDAMQDLPNAYAAGLRGAGLGDRAALVQASVADDAPDPGFAFLSRLYGVEACGSRHVVKAVNEGVEFAMLTLTTPNVKGADLRAEEARFAKGFNDMVRLWLSVVYGRYYLGYVRKLEVTYNMQKTITKQMWEGTGKYNDPMKDYLKPQGYKVGDRNPSYNTYNPHYHVLLAVTPGFFTWCDENQKWVPAISVPELLAAWRRHMNDEAGAIKRVHIQKAHKTRGEGNSATAELSKYVAKDADYNHSPQVFKTFYAALKGVKRMTMGGIFQVFHKLFKDGKLGRYMPADETVYKWEIEYGWHGGGYDEKRRVEISPERAAKIRGMKYNEIYDTEEF